MTSCYLSFRLEPPGIDPGVEVWAVVVNGPVRDFGSNAFAVALDPMDGSPMLDALVIGRHLRPFVESASGWRLTGDSPGAYVVVWVAQPGVAGRIVGELASSIDDLPVAPSVREPKRLVELESTEPLDVMAEVSALVPRLSPSSVTGFEVTLGGAGALIAERLTRFRDEYWKRSGVTCELTEDVTPSNLEALERIAGVGRASPSTFSALIEVDGAGGLFLAQLFKPKVVSPFEVVHPQLTSRTGVNPEPVSAIPLDEIRRMLLPPAGRTSPEGSQ